MGGVTDLEFEKYCKVGQSPKTVLQLPRHQSKVENRSRREKPDLRKDQLVIEKSIKELKFRNYRSISCKTLPSRNAEAVDRKVLNRCSVYQSSLERRPRRQDAVEERKKIEFSLGSEAPFSFSLLDSICGSDEEGEPLEINNSANKETSIVNKIAAGSVELSREPSSLESHCRETSCSSKPAERDLMENLKFRSHRVKGPANSANTLQEKDDQAFRKSLSAKLAMPHSPTRSDNDGSKASPKSRFSPFMKMFEPLSKSKSHRSVPKSKSECKDTKSSGSSQTGENKTFRKSLLQDFLSTAGQPHVESDGSLPVNEENHEQIVPPPCKPGHLQGYLKVEQKHGVPYYTLSLSHTEDVYVAKTWKADDALSWAYTFHSIQGGKKSNANNQGGLKYSNKNPPIVGQMQVSSYLDSEVNDLEGAMTDSMVSEFVLYDILHARKSLASEESNPPDVAEIPGGSNDDSDVSTIFSDNTLDSVKGKGQGTSNPFDLSNHNINNGLDFSSPYPWNPADLHTRFESAAIVIEVPFEKRESMKYRVGDSISRQVHFNLLDRSVEEQTRRAVSDAYNKPRVKVVIPIGNHSWPTPSSDSRGPSQLLDRWRLGGGCDCSGWDMGCPLIVYSDRTTCSGEEHFILRSDQPCDLFLQGSKESTPVLTMQQLGKGHYAINFHAQLSALQAFAVYVSILHTREVSTSVNQEKNRQFMKCYSTKVLVGDEIKTLIEEVTQEERKEKVRGATDTGHHPHPSYVLNPPFSPISRV